MRRLSPTLQSLLLLASLGATTAACNLVLGIGDPALDTTTSTTGAGGSATTATTGDTTTSASATTSTTGVGGSGGALPPCALTKPVCTAVKSDCVALVDNSTLDEFALRIAQISFFKPDAFTGVLEKSAFLTSVTMNLKDCNLKGSGTFSWLVALDLPKGEFTLGASKPPADPHDGYSFVNETVMQNGAPYQITPTKGTISLAPDGTINPQVIDSILLPAYLDAAATQLLLVPLHKARLYDTKLSPDHNCVGSYNAFGLKPENGCLPNVPQNIYSFVDGGRFDGYILLEEADQIIIEPFGLNRSLCVLLSNNASVFGDGASPAKCKRDQNGKIKFGGDWCSATNAGADASCYDAAQFDVGFAASGVKLNP